MKCLEKQRDRRYETANAAARDVQRYLADEAVEARPPSAGYRLQKFVRRNKGQVIAASLVLFALIAGSIAVAAVQRSANLRLAEANALIAEQRDEANRQRVFATEAQVKAEQSEATARKQAILALKNIQFIVTDVDDRLAKQPGSSQLRVDLLKVVEKKWDELDIALTGGIKGQAIPTLMAVRAKIADAWLNLDKLQEADAQCGSSAIVRRSC